MSSSSSSYASHSDGEEDTTDAKNLANHNNFYNGRGESCPADLIQDHAVRKIIFDRGFMDGINMRRSIPSELRSVNASNEAVEVAAMTNITNASIIADVALRSSLNALDAANLAIDLVAGSAEVTSIEGVVKIALDAVEATEILASLARSISRRSRRLLDGHELND